jgi:anaerobic selenocysteine-containing dehydrogenase
VLPPVKAYGFGTNLEVRGLANTAAGMPTAALPDMMLREDEMRIRAMICCGGNPVAAWPDQRKTVAALDRLDLLVQIDPWMSATSRLADYVIAPQIWLEVAGTSQILDWLTRNGTGYGQADPYAQYSPALLEPPKGSDLIEEWVFFYELAKALDLPVSVSAGLGPDMPPAALDMAARPSSDALLEILCTGSKVPLAEVKAIEGGAIFPGAPVHVAAGSGDERFELARPEMMADLIDEAWSSNSDRHGFRLLCRRMMHVYNSSFVGALPASVRPYNPVFLAPDDLTMLGLMDGDAVEIASEHASIPAIALADDTLRRGVASMSFGFGSLPEDDAAYRLIGSNPNRLIRNDIVFDRYSGQPLMTNIPVDIRPLAGAPSTIHPRGQETI